MFVVLVYDTAAERNPDVLKTCRRYLHWVQRSVFQGELSVAQHRSLIAALRQAIDPSHDSIRIYVAPSEQLVRVEQIGTELGNHQPVL
jgi:CRISPR-associated protein Cas2